MYFLLTKRFDLHAEHDGEKEEVQAREPALLQSLQRRLVAILEGRDELCCSCDRGSGVRRPHHTASSPAKSRLHIKNKEHLCPCGRFRGVHCDAAGDQEAEWYPTRMVTCIVSSEERRPTIPRNTRGAQRLGGLLNSKFYFSRFRFPTCEEELIEARHLNAPGDLREVRVVSCATNDVRSVSSSYDVNHRRFFCLRGRKVEDTVRETPSVDSTQAVFQSSF